MQEAVGVEGVARPGSIEMEVQPDTRGVGGDPCLRTLRVGTAHTVFGDEPVQRVTLRRGGRVRVELETPPDDADLVTMLETGQRGLEAALADVTPRTDDVRPDLNIHAGSSTHSRTVVIAQAGARRISYSDASPRRSSRSRRSMARCLPI